MINYVPEKTVEQNTEEMLQCIGNVKTGQVTYAVRDTKIEMCIRDRPQRDEYFVDSGFYKFHEAYHLLRFSNEKQILEKAYNEYLDLKKSNLWGNKKYF